MTKHAWPVIRVGGCCAAAPGASPAAPAPWMFAQPSVGNLGYGYPYPYSYPYPYAYAYPFMQSLPYLYGPTDPAVIQAYRMGQRWM